jgi:hypothetical protein
MLAALITGGMPAITGIALGGSAVVDGTGLDVFGADAAPVADGRTVDGADVCAAAEQAAWRKVATTATVRPREVRRNESRARTDEQIASPSGAPPKRLRQLLPTPNRWPTRCPS